MGSYNSSLTAAYYQELLDLLDKAISSGDLSGGSAFDRSSLLKLESQAQSFASLPLGTAGVRVMDDSFNYPFSLLEARIKALVAEAGTSPLYPAGCSMSARMRPGAFAFVSVFCRHLRSLPLFWLETGPKHRQSLASTLGAPGEDDLAEAPSPAFSPPLRESSPTAQTRRTCHH
jgi:hypothetical protein